MESVNRTMYIPLYGKAYVSKKGIIIDDKKAEEIWEKEKFKLKGKSKSKWLAYYLSIRAVVFDEWIKNTIENEEDVIILHIGCGLDSRILRVNAGKHYWFDIDFMDVINERKKYYKETDNYKMICGDARELEWFNCIPKANKVVVILEGISMYLTNTEIKKLFHCLDFNFKRVSILMDCYSCFAAKMSKIKNPIKTVGVSHVYGVDDPSTLNSSNIKFLKKHTMVPKKYIEELSGFERTIFSKLYAGRLSKKLYKLYEFEK